MPQPSTGLRTPRKLRNTVVLTVGVFALVFPLLVLAGFAWLYYPERLETAHSYVQERNRAISAFVEGYFREIRNTVQLLGAMPAVASAPWAPETVRQDVLRLYREAQRANPNIDYVYSGYTDGTLLINDYTPPPGFDPRVRPWYRAVMDARGGRQEVVGLLYAEATTGELLLATARLLTGPDRSATGVLSIDSHTREIAAQIEARSHIFASAQSFLIDSTHTIVAHANHALIGKPVRQVWGG